MIIQGQCQAQPTTSATDGNQYVLTLGKTLDLITSQLHGKYLTQAMRGNLWMAALTSAAQIPVSATNATPSFCIWNPAGNNKAVSLIRLQLGFTGTIPTPAAIGYSYIPSAGSTIGGTAAVSAFTALTVRSCILSQGYTGNVMAGSAATITGTGLAIPVVCRWSPFSEGTLGTASIPPAMNMQEDFDGMAIIPPNVLWYIHASAATASTYMVSAVWSEVPWP